MKKLVRVSYDGKDWSNKWNNTAAIRSVCYYDPNFNYSDLDLFFFKYTPKAGDAIVNVGVENGAEIPEEWEAIKLPGVMYAPTNWEQINERNPGREIELYCNANNIPDKLQFDLITSEIGDSIKISNIELPEGVKPTITDRDFVVATLVPPTVEVEETKPAEEDEESTEESKDGDKTEDKKEESKESSKEESNPKEESK